LTSLCRIRNKPVESTLPSKYSTHKWTLGKYIYRMTGEDLEQEKQYSLQKLTAWCFYLYNNSTVLENIEAHSLSFHLFNNRQYLRQEYISSIHYIYFFSLYVYIYIYICSLLIMRKPQERNCGGVFSKDVSWWVGCQ
jgi:hypothetical protein